MTGSSGRTRGGTPQIDPGSARPGLDTRAKRNDRRSGVRPPDRASDVNYLINLIRVVRVIRGSVWSM